jgi:hypothetical protein
MHLYAQRALRDRLGRNGRVFVEQYFDRTVLARHYETLLLSLVPSRSPSVQTAAPTLTRSRFGPEFDLGQGGRKGLEHDVGHGVPGFDGEILHAPLKVLDNDMPGGKLGVQRPVAAIASIEEGV